MSTRGKRRNNLGAGSENRTVPTGASGTTEGDPPPPAGLSVQAGALPGALAGWGGTKSGQEENSRRIWTRRRGKHKHPGFGRPPGMHWVNLKAKTWPETAPFLRDEKAGDGKRRRWWQQGSLRGRRAGAASSSCWARTLGTTTGADCVPGKQERPAPPAWRGSRQSEASLEHNTRHTDSHRLLTASSTCAGTNQKNDSLEPVTRGSNIKYTRYTF